VDRTLPWSQLQLHLSNTVRCDKDTTTMIDAKVMTLYTIGYILVLAGIAPLAYYVIAKIKAIRERNKRSE
jgi:hypothetical protein